MSGRRSMLPAAVSLSILGLMADDIVLAAHRARDGLDLDGGGLRSLRAAKRLLSQVQALASPVVDFAEATRDLPPVETLNEAFDVIQQCRGDIEVLDFLAMVLDALASMDEGTAAVEQLDLVERYFEAVSVATLRAAAHPRRRRIMGTDQRRALSPTG